jgi:hypothetical protein
MMSPVLPSILLNFGADAAAIGAVQSAYSVAMCAPCSHGMPPCLADEDRN